MKYDKNNKQIEDQGQKAFNHSTNSSMASSQPSPTRLTGSFKILVYPPFLPSYLTAISSKSFFTADLLGSMAKALLLEARSPLLAKVTSFSTIGFTAFAF